jgi:hypothetical protein
MVLSIKKGSENNSQFTYWQGLLIHINNNHNKYPPFFISSDACLLKRGFYPFYMLLHNLHNHLSVIPFFMNEFIVY